MTHRHSIVWTLLASYGVVILVAVATHLLVAYPLIAAHHAAMGAALREPRLGLLLQSLLWAGLAAVVLAASLAVLFARGVARPIRQMVAATRRIAAGDYGQRVPVASHDELGELAQALNEMAAGLERVEALRRELVANVAHELRTPLAGLEGYLEGLADGVFPPTPATFDRIRTQTGRLRRLVDDLTELSRLESGQTQLARRPMDVAEVIEESVAALRPQFEQKGVALEVAVGTERPTLLGDADRVDQLLTNLLANAVRFTPPGGRVAVEASSRRGVVRLAVSDTGIGIAPEDLPHIFERFYRADHARAQGTGGSGIGLAIVKHIVQAHGGTITVESAPGRGSRFEASLPGDGLEDGATMGWVRPIGPQAKPMRR